MYQAGVGKMVEEELEIYKEDETLQEIRWKDVETVDLTKFLLINSSSNNNQLGTGFLVRKG